LQITVGKIKEINTLYDGISIAAAEVDRKAYSG
jgi:hypothetical protein